MKPVTASLAVALLLLPQTPEIGEDPVSDKIKIWDEQWSVPRKQPEPRPIGNPGSPVLLPPVYDPDPFYCRREAPFPNDECITPPEPVEPDDPEVTTGEIEREVKRIGLPPLRITVQPAGSTLVNLETIFHTTVTRFEREVDILGSTVTLRATPTAYTWHHGDGTTQTTSTPGRPYPAMDVTHQYKRPGTARPRVDVTYTVTYRIDDGDWQTLDTTITAPGPSTPLRIREARPVLTR